MRQAQGLQRAADGAVRAQGDQHVEAQHRGRQHQRQGHHRLDGHGGATARARQPPGQRRAQQQQYQRGDGGQLQRGDQSLPVGGGHAYGPVLARQHEAIAAHDGARRFAVHVVGECRGQRVVRGTAGDGIALLERFVPGIRDQGPGALVRHGSAPAPGPGRRSRPRPRRCRRTAPCGRCSRPAPGWAAGPPRRPGAPVLPGRACHRARAGGWRWRSGACPRQGQILQWRLARCIQAPQTRCGRGHRAGSRPRSAPFLPAFARVGDIRREIQIEGRAVGDLGEQLAARAPRSYQPLLRLTIFATDSITGTSTSTPPPWRARRRRKSRTGRWRRPRPVRRSCWRRSGPRARPRNAAEPTARLSR
jgi:hypothetical protein